MIHLRTISRRIGAFHVLVIALLLGSYTVMLFSLGQMGVDSARLLEEAREQAVLAKLGAELRGLQGLLMQSTPVDPAELARGRAVLREAAVDAAGLDDPPQDPSRAEHQAQELKLSRRLQDDLARVDEMLVNVPLDDDAVEARGWLSSAGHYADILRAEAREEAREANSDLMARYRSVRRVIQGVLILALLLLGLAMYMIHCTVVAPLRRLRDGAERFGGGDLGHRVLMNRVDEIGGLASSFNTMADRLAHAQQDLEERVRRRTREFLRAARLADLGILASGIAHEINTPLASIAISAEGMQRVLRGGDGANSEQILGEFAETIAREAYRARDITTRMLALVRQDPSALSEFSLQLIVERSESALQHVALQRGVQIVTDVPARDVTLHVNSGELVQILVNLLSNAVDASSRGGQVVLRARIEAGTLAVDVTDEGMGLAEADVDRVFEPFYTTKLPGEGTGLGLAIVATMVASRRGHIWVESEVEQGCMFRITLPIDWRVPG